MKPCVGSVSQLGKICAGAFRKEVYERKGGFEVLSVSVNVPMIVLHMHIP